MNFAPNVLLLTATIADICITLFGLGIGLVEANPLVYSVGWINILLGKLLATLVVIFVLRLHRERLGGLAFIPGLVVALVVLWNVFNVTVHLI